MRFVLATATILLLGEGSVGFSQPIVGGFVEGVQAVRIEKNAALGDGGLGERTYPRSEFRAQLSLQNIGEREQLFLRTDVVTDGTESAERRVRLDLREGYVKLRLAEWLDLKAGRQVATWGTGDLVFANDLFAKDWEAFFTALNDSYLKAPQDLLRLTAYVQGVAIDVAGSPYFTPDHLPMGERMSVYDPIIGEAVIAGAMSPVIAPPRNLGHGEVFLRASGALGSSEIAFYGYTGFWPTPQGVTVSAGHPVLHYPRLQAIGSSARGPIGSFMSHAEIAYYRSGSDVNGEDPLIANSQIRGFAGTERSFGKEWTVAAQYYAEWMMDYPGYQAATPSGAPTFDEVRSTATLRVTKLARHQTVQFSVFGYWGISDDDWHLRPSVSYDVTDAVKWTVGGSLLDGAKPYTMFGQFRGNSNVFTRLRYSF